MHQLFSAELFSCDLLSALADGYALFLCLVGGCLEGRDRGVNIAVLDRSTDVVAVNDVVEIALLGAECQHRASDAQCAVDFTRVDDSAHVVA